MNGKPREPSSNEAAPLGESAIVIIRRGLADDRRALRAAVDDVPPEHRQERPAPGRWSVAEVLEHLAIVEERSVRVVQKLAEAAPLRAGAAEPPPTPLDRSRLQDRSRLIMAPDAIQPTGTMTADEAWVRLERTRAALESALAANEDRDFTKVTRVHPAIGELDGYQWIAAIGGHEARHAAQIREIARTCGGRRA